MIFVGPMWALHHVDKVMCVNMTIRNNHEKNLMEDLIVYYIS